MKAETSVKLEKLHSVLTKLFGIREELRQGPLQAARMQKQVDVKNAQLATLREELMTLRKGADAKSLQLKSNEAKIAELQIKLNAASSNRDFQIIKSQIESDEMANSVLEDEILEGLDLVDAKQIEIANTEDDIKNSEATQQQKADDVSKREVVLQQQVVEVESNLKEAERAIPAKHGDMYRRLVRSHSEGALASVEAKVCTSCYTIFTSQEMVNMNVGKFMFCRSCGRDYLSG